MKEISIYNGTQMMTSLEIAEVTGKNHFDVLRAIRKMELAWQKVTDCLSLKYVDSCPAS